MARRPQWVYREGQEPDYRFSFANERTFLAWIRTSLALLAAGIALGAVQLDLADRTQHLVAVVLIVMGIGCALAAWLRWARAERAIRQSAPLPGFGMGLPLTLVLVAVALIVVLFTR